MNRKRTIATLASMIIGISSIPICGNDVYADVISDFTESNYETVTLDYITYNIYDDYAVLVSCDNSVSGKVVIPDKVGDKPVTIIETNSFKNCTNFSTVIIPNTVTRINKYAFYGCNMTFLTIGESVEVIEDGAFADCKSLCEIIIPDNVKMLGSIIKNGTISSDCGVFSGCTSAKSIEIGNGVEVIGDNCFKGCSYTSNWTVGQNVLEIGNCAFYNCTIQSFIFPDNVTYVGSYAFSNCSNLYSVSLNNKLCVLSEKLFSGTKITNLVIPKSVSVIKEGILSSNKDVEITILNPDCSIPASGYVFASNSKNVTIRGYKDSTADVYAKRYDCKFESVTDSYAEVVIDSDVSSDTDYMFKFKKQADCVQITDVTIFNNIKTLEVPSHIDELPVTYIELKNVENVDSLIVADNMENYGITLTNCSFKNMQLDMDNLTTFNISGCDNINTLNLSDMSVSESTYYGNYYTASIDISLSNLRTLILPKNVTALKDSRIAYCSNLQNIVFPEHLEYIDLSVIRELYADVTINLPNTIKEVELCYSDTGSGDDAHLVGPTIIIPKNTFITSHHYPGEQSYLYGVPNRSTICYYKNSIMDYLISKNYPIDKNPINSDYLLECGVTFKLIDDSESTNDVDISQLIAENTALKNTLASYGNRAYGDINNDGFVDGRDATLLLTYYAKTSVGYVGSLDDFIKEQNGE